jgi:predicted TIM-barrel fold metal-dependent hydrolase
MRIDVHTHFQSLDFIQHLHGRSTLPRTIRDGGTYMVQCAAGLQVPALPKMVDMDEKLRDMNNLQIDRSVLSHGLPLGPDVLGGEEADEWAMRINDDLARIIQTSPDKFLGLGSFGFGSAQRAIAEVDRCIHQLGFKGFQIFSNVAHRWLDSPEFRPVFQHIGQLGVPVNLHPAVPPVVDGLTNGSVLLALGFPYDSSLNTVRLIQSGLFDEVPDLKVIVSHAGGVLPYLMGRLEVYAPPSPLDPDPSTLLCPLGQYVRNLYVDTVSYHREALICCHGVMGAQHMFYGTDHPLGARRLRRARASGLALARSGHAPMGRGGASADPVDAMPSSQQRPMAS